MKKQIIFFVLIVVLTATALNSEEVRGLTNKILTSGKLEVIGSARTYSPSFTTRHQQKTTTLTRENWLLVDSLNFNSYIQPEMHFGVFYDNSVDEISLFSSCESLEPEALEALGKAPKWLRPALGNTFLQLTADLQQVFGDVINNSFDPYIDEVAYVIAHCSPEFLSSQYCNPDLFFFNAVLIYQADNSLGYVDIIDYGSSTTDENYYSTIRYWKIDELGNTVEVEVPKEIYYMYMVHTKITDEIPAYIDPDIIENNNTHNNNIALPPTGKFWRQFLFCMADAGYPVLEDELVNCTVVWDESGGTTDTAIHIITDWINASMEFTSNAERPHQPVRIYRKHIGRCGEHADLTAAAARAALIPCTSILAISEDHTWNEFWDEEWIHWEPVNGYGYINNPLVYEDGWGKVFASVFEIKSNGYLTPVTDTYSDTIATIIIYALDNDGEPIDGAKITLKILNWWDNWGYTDKEGKCTFIVGEGRTYYARMDSEIGNDPVNVSQVYEIVTNSVGGQTYTYSMNAAGSMPEVQYSSIPTPDDEVDDYRLIVDFTVPQQIITGAIIMDDTDGTNFYNGIDDGIINCFMTDVTNYGLYSNEQMFNTFNEMICEGSGTIEFDIPVDESWYAFFDNGFSLNNPQNIEGSVSLYEYDETSTDDDIVVVSNKLIGNYPNPFNPTTTIYFSTTEHTENTEILIYNLKGQKVKTLVNDQLDEGLHQVIWNGTNETNQQVSSGIYFYKLKTGEYSAVKKMVMMK